MYYYKICFISIKSIRIELIMISGLITYLYPYNYASSF